MNLRAEIYLGGLYLVFSVYFLVVPSLPHYVLGGCLYTGSEVPLVCCNEWSLLQCGNNHVPAASSILCISIPMVKNSGGGVLSKVHLGSFR